MSTLLDKNKIIKQGWLEKKSKHLKSWRSRWVILTAEYLYVYKQQSISVDAKKVIQLSSIQVSSGADTTFHIEGSDDYWFKAKTESEKTEWIKCIDKYTYNCIKVPISLECHRDNTFNDNFELIIPYDENYVYSVNTLITEIINYANKKHDPFKLFVTRIKTSSFMGRDMNYNDYDWDESDINITEYEQQIVEQIGMELEIDMEIYKHNVLSSMDSICKEMKSGNELCPMYARMRYQDIFSEEDLNHLYEYQHPDQTECKFGDQCYAYKRLEAGGNELKDRSHIMIYRHPPRGLRGGKRSRELREQMQTKEISNDINSFCLNDEWFDNTALYRPKEAKVDEKDGYLKCLITEVTENEFQSDLCLTDDDMKNNSHTLMIIVDEKLQCLRHKLMGSPLNRAEMLSILLYTGGDSNHELCKSQRNGDYLKWKWFDYCLYNAINKLSKREYGSYKVYTGLGSTQLKDKYVECGYFKTYVSTSWVKDIALTFVDDKGMIFEIDENFRETAICCDVSWISKFGQNECEILIARSIDAVLNCFECKIIDQQSGLQTVSLKLFGSIKNKKIQRSNKVTMEAPLDIEHELTQFSIIDDKPKEYHLKKRLLTRQHKLVVYGFIRRIHQTLSKYLIISLDIYDIVCLFCDDYKPSDFFDVFADGIKVSNKNKTAKRMSGKTGIAYGHVNVMAPSKGLHKWKLHIDKINTNVWGSKKIIIGIDSSNRSVFDKKHSLSNSVTFYGFDSKGGRYTGGSYQKPSNKLYLLKQEDIILVVYDSLKRVLSLTRELYPLNACQLSKVPPAITYYLAISIEGMNDQITLIDYNAESKITILLLGSRRKHSIEENNK